MKDFRIHEHPVLPVPEKEELTFYWNEQPLKAKRGEVISSALFANGIKVFGHHHKDDTAQGIFCANGQCAKCTVIANGLAVKSCMTEVKENMMVQSADGLPKLPETANEAVFEDIEEIETDVLIIGGGPAGLTAALELEKFKIPTLIIDDKAELGGKLVLQTHKFFGSVEDSYAGTRGNDIGRNLADEVFKSETVVAWANSTAIYVFKDKKVGIVKDGVYKLVTPKVVLNAAGAREKFLRFQGNHLAGIYGAGAFQTLVNRDLIRPTERLFIIGGGNVGLIAGYHALQAGIEVVGLVEAMPTCGGYKVHADKLKRFGVPIYTSHSIVCANGEEAVESITIAEINNKFERIEGTEKSFECDTILVAVGLESLSEFSEEAELAGIPVFGAGDALEIAEASSAMFNGRIAGLKVAKFLEATKDDVPEAWFKKAEILKSHPGKIIEHTPPTMEEGVMPNIFCLQEIPCNPCSTVCPTNAINMKGDPIMDFPQFEGKCIGCGQCVAICPGLAITLVDYRKDAENPIVTLPYEIGNMPVQVGDFVQTVAFDGEKLEKLEVVNIKNIKNRKTQLVEIKAPKAIAKQIASFQVQADDVSKPMENPVLPTLLDDDSFVCLCERVTVGQVRKLIKEGISDLNQIKAITRSGMGPCGSKTCDNLVRQILRQEGMPIESVVPNKRRPVFVEVPIGLFANIKE
jgi:thioredoxin reductase/Fe-S-cluster-containing hydrogenase component 2/bacterioferritin-associated ferredoxin